MAHIIFSDIEINQGCCTTCTRHKSDSYNYKITCTVADNEIVNDSQGYYCPYYNEDKPIKI